MSRAFILGDIREFGNVALQTISKLKTDEWIFKQVTKIKQVTFEKQTVYSRKDEAIHTLRSK